MSPTADSSGGIPSRSEIEAWSTRDLDVAAARWRTSATESDEAFAQHRANIVSTNWAGDAKDAAVNRVTADTVVVGNQSAVQRAGAQIAGDGSRDIQAAKREAMDAIAEAEANGFEVGEDLALRDTREVDETMMAARTMAAREHAEDIRWYAERLVQADGFVGKRLQEKAAELEGIRFTGEGDQDSSVQLVDNKVEPDDEDKPEGKDGQPNGGGDRTLEDMLLPPDESDTPDAEGSPSPPDAQAGEGADRPDGTPPNPLDVLAGKGADANPDGTPANLDEALFGPGAAAPPSVLDRLTAQARGEKGPTDTPYTQSPLEAPTVAADPSVVDRQAARVEAAQQAVAAAQAEIDAAAGQGYAQGAGAGPGRDVTDPLSQKLFDARADLTAQTEILENLNQAAADTGNKQADVPALPPNADVQAFPAPPSFAEQAAEGLKESSSDISEATFGIVPDYAHTAEVFANWDEHSGADQLSAVLDTAGSLPVPGAKPLGEALEHGIDAFTAGRHADDVVQPGIPHDVIDGPNAGPSSPAAVGDQPSPVAAGEGHSVPITGIEHHPAPLGAPTTYAPEAPGIAADLNNAFTHGQPTTDLTRQLADLSTHHFGDADRVVLGKWDGQEGGYIGEARNSGGIFFDTGDDTWAAMENGLGESQKRALGWQVNEQFLRTQLENHVPRIEYVLPDGFSSVDEVAMVRRESFSALEINYLIDNAENFGYQRIGNAWVYQGGK